MAVFYAETFSFWAQKNILHQKIDVAIARAKGPTLTAVMSAMTFQHAETGCPVGGIPLSLSKDEARELMDALWSCGVRPTEDGTAGQLAATEKHLADMRALVFQKITILQEEK